VPALVCDLCEEACYEPDMTDAVVALLKETEIGPARQSPSSTAPPTRLEQPGQGP